MAKKQSRRSVSLSRELYDRALLHCEANNLSMSRLVEMCVAPALAMELPPARRVGRVHSRRWKSEPEPAPQQPAVPAPVVLVDCSGATVECPAPRPRPPRPRFVPRAPAPELGVVPTVAEIKKGLEAPPLVLKKPTPEAAPPLPAPLPAGKIFTF